MGGGGAFFWGDGGRVDVPVTDPISPSSRWEARRGQLSSPACSSPLFHVHFGGSKSHEQKPSQICDAPGSPPPPPPRAPLQVRENVLARIAGLRRPKTNIQIHQQGSLLKAKPLVAFIKVN